MKRLLSFHLVQIVSIFLLLCGIAWPFLNQPAHWDETAYIDGVRTIYEARGFPFVEFWSYKPPLHFEIGAVMWAVFGVGRWQLRLVTILALTVLLYVFKLVIQSVWQTTYQVIPQQARWYWQVGAWLLLALLATNPVVVGQAFLYQPEILLVALWLLVIYLYVRGGWVWYWITASLMLLVKESAALQFAVILAIEVIRALSSRGEWPSKIKRFCLLASPALWLFGWLIGNKLVLGWWLWPHNIEFFSADKPYDAPALVKLTGIFIDNYVWLTTLLAGASLVLLFRQFRQLKTRYKFEKQGTLSYQTQQKALFEQYTYLHLLFGAGVLQVLFALVGAFIPRYTMSVYPALIIVVAMGYSYFGHKGGMWRIAVPITIGIFVLIQVTSVLSSAKMKRFDGWALDHDLRYMHTTLRYQELHKWWQAQRSNHVLIGDWLAWTYFIDPLYGYVDAPLPVKKFEGCEQVMAQQQPFLLMTGIGNDTNENQAIVACAHALQLQSLDEFRPIVVYTAKDE